VSAESHAWVAPDSSSVGVAERVISVIDQLGTFPSSIAQYLTCSRAGGVFAVSCRTIMVAVFSGLACLVPCFLLFSFSWSIRILLYRIADLWFFRPTYFPLDFFCCCMHSFWSCMDNDMISHRS